MDITYPWDNSIRNIRIRTSMGMKEICGEVPGKDCIQVGDVVKVLYGTHECIGRLNRASRYSIEVGRKIIDVRDIIKIETPKA